MPDPTCSMCENRDLFYARRYSGERLCRNCFSDTLRRKVESTIAKYKMFRRNDTIGVAVSGGRDSLTLLHILSRVERSYPEASLIALSVDEGIAGYRDKALKTVARDCRELGVEHRTASFKDLYGCTLDNIAGILKTMRDTGSNLCACCDGLRRRAMNVAAESINADKIATAHTLDDEVESVLLNILRGDVTRIARGGSHTASRGPTLVPWVKPFRQIPEEETALLAYIKKINPIDIPCPYAAESMGSRIRFFLRRMEHKHVGMRFSMISSMERLRPSNWKIVGGVSPSECVSCGELATAGSAESADCSRN